MSGRLEALNGLPPSDLVANEDPLMPLAWTVSPGRAASKGSRAAFTYER